MSTPPPDCSTSQNQSRVRAEVLLALLDQVDLAERAFVGHPLGLHVLGREEQFLGIHQQHALPAAGVDHHVGLFQRHAQRLLADDVLAGVGDIDGHLGVQGVGGGDGDHLDVRLLEHLAIVVEDPRNAVLLGQLLGMPGRGRGDGHHLRLFGHDLERRRVDIGLELRADDADLDLSRHLEAASSSVRGSSHRNRLSSFPREDSDNGL